MSSTSYPVSPPSYQAAGTSKTPFTHTDAAEPLLGRPSGGGIYDQPETGDVPDDFKVCLGFSVPIGIIFDGMLVWGDCF